MRNANQPLALATFARTLARYDDGVSIDALELEALQFESRSSGADMSIGAAMSAALSLLHRFERLAVTDLVRAGATISAATRAVRCARIAREDSCTVRRGLEG